jgi:hypothetical protein
MLGDAISVTVDTKGVEGDRFDDLTIIRTSGRRSRVQIKHTTQDRQLSQATFTGDARSLRLDLVIDSALKDLKGHGDTTYATLVRDREPDGDLSKVLLPVAAEASEDAVPGFLTRRYRFDPEKLRAGQPWSGLVARFTDAELSDVCSRLTVHTAGPASSLDLRDPGAAEAVLLRRVGEELGAGRPPNTHRLPEDVAAALIQAGTAHRVGDGTVLRDTLVPRIGLTIDFGAVSEGSPIEPAVAVSRLEAVATIHDAVARTAPAGGRLLLVGGPGIGKSWLCQELAEQCRADGSLVARHHCWLGSDDADRSRRVSAEVVIGSLLRQLEEQAPEVFTQLRPRFEASVEGLGKVLDALQQVDDSRDVILVVDGLDHVDRVVGQAAAGSAVIKDPARSLVDDLARVRLPAGACLIIASQSGAHLNDAEPAEPPLQAPPLDRVGIADLAERHGLFTGATADLETQAQIVDLLESRSAGNALYATYLCRHALAAPADQGQLDAPGATDGVVARLQLVPDSAQDLDAYYAHLSAGFDGTQQLAIGILAVCDFAVTEAELAEIVPEVEPTLRSALATLGPVLDSVPGLGGLKVHHESFARFLLRDKSREWLDLMRSKVVLWLEAQGVFADARAFRHLPTLLAQLERYEELCHWTDPTFVVNAIAALQPPQAIRDWIAVLARAAQTRRDWPTLIRCLHLRNAVERYDFESLPDSVMSYSDVVVSLLGAQAVAERLVYNGQTTFPARWGLRLCAAVDTAGVAAPWKAYLQAWERERGQDNTSYGTEENARLDLAVQLGALRLRAQERASSDVDVERLAEHLDTVDDRIPFSALVGVLVSGLAPTPMLRATSLMTDDRRAASTLLVLADLPAEAAGIGLTPKELATAARERTPDANLAEYLRHGVDPDLVRSGLGPDGLPEQLLLATQTILGPGHTPNPGAVRRWLSLLTLAHALDPSLPLSIVNQVSGVGFYRAWLRFVVATVGLQRDVAAGTTSGEAASSAVVLALAALADEASPFVGSPRACDLHSIHFLIHQTVFDAVRVLNRDDVAIALEHLVTIGDGTTTSLMGLAESGPLAMNDLLDLLARAATAVGREPVYALVRELRDRRSDAQSQYSVMADFELGIARICVAAGDAEQAADCWTRACLLLAAYGGHKDPTLDDLLGPLDDLLAQDAPATRQRLGQLRDLAYLVAQHTDGRSTSHYPLTWWKFAARIDPIAAATGACDLRLQRPGYDDARADAAAKALLRQQIGGADAVALAALRLSVGAQSRDPDIDAELLARLEATAGASDGVADVFVAVANNIAADYDGQPLTYASDQNTSVATPELMYAVTRLGGSVFATRQPRDTTRSDSSRWSTSPEPAKAVESVFSGKRPHLSDGPSGAVEAMRDYASAQGFETPAGPRWDREGLAMAIGWRIVEVALADGVEAGLLLVDDLGQELPTFSGTEVMADIGEGLALRLDWAPEVLAPLASSALVHAFTKIRGGGGWQTFAGRDRIDLWTTAHSLDPIVAEERLAAAVADTIVRPTYQTYGVTESVICALAAVAPGQERALECWDAAFHMMSLRLPGEPQTGGHEHQPTPAPDAQPEVDKLLARLAATGVCRPMRTDIRSSLLALALLCHCRPELAQDVLCNVLESDLDAGRCTWILEVLRNHLITDLSEPLKDVLARLAVSPHLSVRVVAAQCLDQAGLPSPEPPVIEADPQIRAALTRRAGGGA